jgi:hypothetical protein
MRRQRRGTACGSGAGARHAVPLQARVIGGWRVIILACPCSISLMTAFVAAIYVQSRLVVVGVVGATHASPLQARFIGGWRVMNSSLPV